MIYLDNAATSWPKPARVIRKMSEFMYNTCANPGRSGHKMAVDTNLEVFKAREAVAKIFNISDPLRIAFLYNTTMALNVAIYGLLNEGDHVITTCMEHNSVLRPLMTLEKQGFISLTIVQTDAYGNIDPDDIKKAINSNTRLVVCTISSNVNGVIMPIRDIGRVTREMGVIFLVDSAQGAGTLEIDVQKMGIDLLAFSGHKSLLGPQGVGGIFVADGVKLKSIFQGGTGSYSKLLIQPDFMPDALETGTLNAPGIVGLREGIEFINEVSIVCIKSRKDKFLRNLYSLISDCARVRVYSPQRNNSGILALSINDMDSFEVCSILDKSYNIAVRGGFHCAPLAHKTLGTYEKGLIRISPGFFNSDDEVVECAEAIVNIAYYRN